MIHSQGRQADWRRQNPEKYAAHLAVAQALADGTLVKQACEVCGTTAGRIDGHHDSYEIGEELNIRWLCRYHHVRHHKGGPDMFPRKDAV